MEYLGYKSSESEKDREFRKKGLENISEYQNIK